MRARLRRSESIEKAAVSDSWARISDNDGLFFIAAVLGFHFC